MLYNVTVSESAVSLADTGNSAEYRREMLFYKKEKGVDMGGRGKKKCPFKKEGEVCELPFKGEYCVSLVASEGVCPAREHLPELFRQSCVMVHDAKVAAKALSSSRLALKKIEHTGQEGARVIHANPYRPY